MNNLTEADLKAIEEMLLKHTCRFPEITTEDMATVKMLANDFTVIKRSFLDKIVSLIIILILILAAFGREIKAWLSGH